MSFPQYPGPQGPAEPDPEEGPPSGYAEQRPAQSPAAGAYSVYGEHARPQSPATPYGQSPQEQPPAYGPQQPTAPPYQGYGQSPGEPPYGQQSGGYPSYQQPGSPYGAYPPQYPGYPAGHGGAPRSMARPGTVVTGCILAWVGGGVGLLLGLIMLVISAATDLSSVQAQIESTGLTTQEFISLLHVVGAIMAVWCVAVIVVAALAYRGLQGFAITLLVMAGVFALLCLLSLLRGNGLSLVFILWVAASGLLVLVPKDARAWYAASAAARRRR